MNTFSIIKQVGSTAQQRIKSKKTMSDVKKVCMQLSWKVISCTDDILIADTSFSLGSWGEQVHVSKLDDGFMVTSSSKVSINFTSFERNTQNIQQLTNFLVN